MNNAISGDHDPILDLPHEVPAEEPIPAPPRKYGSVVERQSYAGGALASLTVVCPYCEGRLYVRP